MSGDGYWELAPAMSSTWVHEDGRKATVEVTWLAIWGVWAARVNGTVVGSAKGKFTARRDANTARETLHALGFTEEVVE